MYVKEDERHKEICTQVEQIQAELANLTVIEMTKKDLKASSGLVENSLTRQICTFSSKRAIMNLVPESKRGQVVCV